MRRFIRENGLGLGFGALFLTTLVAQALVGHADFNQGQAAHHGDPIGLWRYVLSSDYGVDVLENWQSEYLQFTLYIVGTVWLLQRGSPESKKLDEAGVESDRDQKIGRYATADSPKWARVGGLRTRLYSNSLLLVMGTIFLLSWLGQSITGRVAYNAGQFDHQQAAVSWPQYLVEPDFWDRTLQNWQSEFLAIGSMAVLSIYLRQRGSPESKPVGAPHGATGVEG
jgi:uncharacterized protein DUF6766